MWADDGQNELRLIYWAKRIQHSPPYKAVMNSSKKNVEHSLLLVGRAVRKWNL